MQKSILLQASIEKEKLFVWKKIDFSTMERKIKVIKQTRL